MTPARRRKVVALLVLVHVAVFTGLVVWNSSSGASQTWADQAVNGAVLVSELGLLSVWAGLGRGRWLPRVAVSGTLSLAMVCISMSWRIGVSGWMTLIELLWVGSVAILMMMVPVVLALAVVRRLGWRLVLFSSEPPPGGPPLRFSVRHLLALTAVAAGFLSAAYYVRPLATFEQHALLSPRGTSAWRIVVVPGVILLSFLAAPLLAVWACLGVGRPGLRLLVAGFFTLALGSLPGYCFGGDFADYARLAGTTVLQLAIIAASLLVFRAVGYRLVRHPPEGDAARPRAAHEEPEP